MHVNAATQKPTVCLPNSFNHGYLRISQCTQTHPKTFRKAPIKDSDSGETDSRVALPSADLKSDQLLPHSATL
ncbi:hypothetical protein L596_024263 [Steinernema carpocapsae]|uniref:Uncharacterized protein n=1 Tax=Steinernema carpocapsae TaxID=34508 RepID=A0A4U5MG90_STECR|nr:hypothetical protein L596_024263 [Steinernema carpocapsae]